MNYQSRRNYAKVVSLIEKHKDLPTIMIETNLSSKTIKAYFKKYMAAKYKGKLMAAKTVDDYAKLGDTTREIYMLNQWRELEPFYNNCKNIVEISEESNFTLKEVKAILKFADKSVKDMPNNDKNLRNKRVMELFELGFSNTDIGKAFGISRERTRQLLQQLGIVKSEIGESGAIMTKDEESLAYAYRRDLIITDEEICKKLMDRRRRIIGFDEITPIGINRVRDSLLKTRAGSIKHLEAKKKRMQKVPEIIKLKLKGYNLHEIREKTGVHTKYLSEILKDNGFVLSSGDRPKGKWTSRPNGSIKYDEKEIVDMRVNLGLSALEISKRLDLYKDLVTKVLTKHNMNTTQWLVQKRKELNGQIQKTQ